MRKWVVFIVCISLVLAGLSPANSGIIHADTQGEGRWVLQSTAVDQLEEPENNTYRISESASSQQAVSDPSGDVFDASATWTTPQTTYSGGETVSLNLSVAIDQYVWNGKDDGYIHHGFNYMSYWISARIDKPDLAWQNATNNQIRLQDGEGGNQPEVKTDNGTIVIGSDSKTVSATFPDGRSDGEEKTIYVKTPVGQVRYTYIWQAQYIPPASDEEPAATSTDNAQKMIFLNGGVRSVDNKPMRNLQLRIDAFFLSGSETVDNASPDWSLETISDTQGGLFKADIPLPSADPDQIKIKVSGQLHCLLPDRTLMFYLADASRPSASDAITFSVTIDVDPALSDGQGNIQVDRLLSFNSLMVQYLSIGVDEGISDSFHSNIDDLPQLAAFSYHYVWAWNAQYVGGVMFGELNDLKKYPLKIEMNWTPESDEELNQTSHYVPSGENIIRLLPDHSDYDDTSRFTLLHEYGHHFDTATVDGWHMRTIRAREANTDHTPHGGYLNSSTSDSMIEGFATAYAAIVQSFDKSIASPHLVDIYDLGRPGNYIAWQHMGLDEELAIAALLYQTYRQYDQPRSFWQIIQPDYSEFIYYYQELAKDLANRPSALAILEQAAFDGGLFQMPFGNQQYDIGEPFRDANANGRYDKGELFADLMFAVDERGVIIPGQPQEDWDGNPVLGKSSDAARNRQTVYQLPGSFIRLTGERITQALVKIKPDGEPDSQILRAVQDDQNGQKIYIGLISRPLSGTVEIALPGGPVIYSGDLSELQTLRRENALLDQPLASVEIRAEDLPDPLPVGAPTYGDPAASGVFELLSHEQIHSLTAAIAAEARLSDANAGLETAFGDVPDRPHSEDRPDASLEHPAQAPKTNWMLIVLIIVSLCLLAAAAIAGLIFLRRRNKTVTTSYAVKSSHFCRHCGTRQETGNQFCSECGQQI